jgi:hypothetical protein
MWRAFQLGRRIRKSMNIDDSDFNNMFGETYNFDDHLEQNIPPDCHRFARERRSRRGAGKRRPTTIRLRWPCASVWVPIIRADADKYNSQTNSPTDHHQPATLLSLDAKNQAAGDHSVQSDLEISVPRKLAVANNLRRKRGEVSVTGRDGRSGDQQPARRCFGGRRERQRETESRKEFSQGRAGHRRRAHRAAG